MAFGKSKKRESWSSRSLSMIIPDNVKLFQRKGKTVMEKAMHDQTRKSIAPETFYQEVIPASASRSSQDASRRYSRQQTRQPFSSPIAESTTSRSPAPVNVPLSDPVYSEDSALKGEIQEAPFLTLNLGDTPNLLLDISDQYSTVSKHDTDASSMIDTSAEESAEFSGEVSGSKDTNETESHNVNSSESSTPKPEKGPNDGEAHELDVSQMPWVLPARDAPLIGNMADLKIIDTSSPVDEATPLGESAGAETPSLRSSSNRQDSSISEVSTPESPASNEFLIDPHRKILVNRGVYIFDPATAQDVMNLQLSADESFNPFEYE